MTSWPTIRARFLIGRPGVTYAQVSTPDDLARSAERISMAYQQAQAVRPWPFHVIALQHSGGWTERLVSLLDGQEAVAELSRAMESCRGCNEGKMVVPVMESKVVEPTSEPPAVAPPTKSAAKPSRPSVKEPAGQGSLL